MYPVADRLNASLVTDYSQQRLQHCLLPGPTLSAILFEMGCDGSTEQSTSTYMGRQTEGSGVYGYHSPVTMAFMMFERKLWIPLALGRDLHGKYGDCVLSVGPHQWKV